VDIRGNEGTLEENPLTSLKTSLNFAYGRSKGVNELYSSLPLAVYNEVAELRSSLPLVVYNRVLRLFVQHLGVTSIGPRLVLVERSIKD